MPSCAQDGFFLWHAPGKLTGPSGAAGRAGKERGGSPSLSWQGIWSLRTDSTDARLLARTRDAVDGMESHAPRSAELSTLTDSRMRRTTHEESLSRALFAGEITYMDVYSASKHDLSVGLNGERAGMRYAVLFVDAFSRFKRVYFTKSERELPGLARHYLSELGHSVHAGGHFVLGAGCRRYMNTDGGLAMNSEAFVRVLMDFGLAANVTSCPHTPASNGVAERTFATIGPDVRAALAMSGIGFKHWHWAFRAALAARNKLASQRVVDEEPEPEARSRLRGPVPHPALGRTAAQGQVLSSHVEGKGLRTRRRRSPARQGVSIPARLDSPSGGRSHRILTSCDDRRTGVPRRGAYSVPQDDRAGARR
jgi:hypothetical protein